MTFGKGKVFLKKFFISIFIFSIIVQQVLAHGREFKNMLVDLEIGRAGENSYKVNLKTEVPYPDEIKIVKKSDYNYYILLAETYSLVSTTKSSGVIKSIKVDTYPYAEQNFENGFTKVTFSTTRPVDFVVSLSANRASKFPVMDLVRLARLDNLYKEGNFDYLNPKYKVASVAVPTKSQAAPQKQAAEKELKQVQKQPVTAQKQAPTQKIAQAQKQASAAQKPAETVKESAKKPVVQKPAPKAEKVVQTPVKTAQASVEPAKVAQKPATTKVAQAQKPAQVKKVEPVQKPVVAAKKQESQKVAQAPQKQVVKVEAKPQQEKKPVEKPVQKAQKTPQVPDKIAQAPKAKEQIQAPKEIAKESQKSQPVDVQSPKEMPQLPSVNKDKPLNDIELELIEKIDEEPVQNDFKNMLLSFLIGNKTGILAGAILLVVILAALRAKKKPQTRDLTPVLNAEIDEIQEVENFANVLDKEENEVQEEAPQQEIINEQIVETVEEIEEIETQEEIQPLEEVAQEELETAEEVHADEIVAEEPKEELAQEIEEAQQEEIIEEINTEETLAQEKIKEQEEIPEIVASVPIEETPIVESIEAKETEAEFLQELDEAQEIETMPQAQETKTQEQIEEEIQQEINQEIENENAELIDIIEDVEEDILEVAEIKEEIVSVINGASNPLEDEIPVAQEKENISVHNLDVINRQAPSGNYDDEEDLIELDTIKDEIAEIKNNITANKQAEKEVGAIQIQKEEKIQNIQKAPQVEIQKPVLREISKPVPELKTAPSRVQKQEPKQAPQKPLPPKVAPVKKAPVARILCKTQIENDRGLYLADYAGNKALVGYVNNNVFVLYNFKKTKIMNNEIIFRLSEAKPKEDLYYVMVDNKKFLIKSEQYRLSLMQKIS